MFSVLVGLLSFDAGAAQEQRGITREEFDRQMRILSKRGREIQAHLMIKRWSIFDEDSEYVEKEVQKKVREGIDENVAFEEVVGKEKEDRIEKAYFRLLHVHLPTEKDKNQIKNNFTAVKQAMTDAEFISDSIHIAIPLIESRYDVKAFNIATRLNNETVKGMWQFTESTAKEYGLDVTKKGKKQAGSDSDQRYNPKKSSQAAKRYLDQLNGFEFTHGCPATPELVLASYHMGQGNANRKIKKYGCDFWAWKKDGKDGFGTHSYNYPALVLAGRKLLTELQLDLNP